VASVDRGAARPVRAGAVGRHFPSRAEEPLRRAMLARLLAWSSGLRSVVIARRDWMPRRGATSMTACPPLSRLVTLIPRMVCPQLPRLRERWRYAEELLACASRPSPNTRIHQDVPRCAVPGNGRLWGSSRPGLSSTAAARFSGECHSLRLTPPSPGLSALGAVCHWGERGTPLLDTDGGTAAEASSELLRVWGWLSGRSFRRSRLRRQVTEARVTR
jgi:hypothetical protein